MEYFLQVGTESAGPLSLEELRARSPRGETLVWRQGMPDWVRADQLDELRSLFQSAPAAWPSTAAASQPAWGGPAPAAGGLAPVDASPYASPTFASVTATPSREAPHSGLGIASTILGAFVLLAELGTFVAIMVRSQGGEAPDEQFNMLIGSVYCGGAVFNLIGLGLAIGGFVQANRKRLFPILGSVLNGGAVLCFLGLMVVGFAAMAAAVK